jgi:hypothetical protein
MQDAGCRIKLKVKSGTLTEILREAHWDTEKTKANEKRETVTSNWKWTENG